jgi:branched-chain amino acid transport system ATP-binding protein
MNRLTVSGLVTGYGSAPPVLDGFDLEIDSAGIVALLGPNGVGKTTLLKSLCGLLAPRAGRIELDGVELPVLKPEKCLARGIALVPEGRRLFTSLSVAENLRCGAISKKGPPDLDRVFDLFPRLKERLTVRAGALSGGEQQMLAVSRAVLAQPTVLLIDEPSLGLAPITARAVFDALRQLADSGTAVLLAEQNLRLALSVADSAVVLSDGRATFRSECRTDAAKHEVIERYRSVTQLGAA